MAEPGAAELPQPGPPLEPTQPTSPGRDRWGVAATLLLTLIFCAPMLVHPSGLRQGDNFRDEDWLHDISFSFYLKESLLTHGEFPLRTNLVGGGYPILGHPSDGTMSPFSLPFLVLSPEVSVRFNLILLLWLGTLGIYGLARRHFGLDRPAALCAAAAFAFSGWFPSFMLAGFYVQAFYLLAPATLYMLLSPGHSLRRALLAGLLLCPVLFQAGTGLAAIAHFLAIATFLLSALRHDPEKTLSPLKAALAVGSVVTGSFILAHYAQWGWAIAAGAGFAFVAAALAWKPLRSLLVAWRPSLGRLVLALVVLTLVGAGKWVSVQDLLSRSDYLQEYLPTMQAQQDGERGFHYQYGTPMEAQDCFYDGIPSLLRNLQFPLERETAYRDESPIHPEYAPLGLTLPVVIVALCAFAAWRRSASLLALLLFYLAICMGPNLPGDPYRHLVWGLPGFYSLNQPYKYFNFFLVVPIALLFGLAVDAAVARLGRTRLILGAASILLAWPLLQNAALFTTLFKEPAVISERPPEFFQVSRPRQLDPDSPDRFGDLAELDRSDREHNRTDDTREFFNVPRGIGLVDWYADIYLEEYAWARYWVRRDGTRLENPDFKGEAWCKAGDCEIESIATTMNTVTVKLRAARADRLIVNQNYDLDFVSEQGPVVEQDGLLAIDITEPGEQVIHLEFRPPHVLRALRISAFSFVTVIAVLLGTVRRRTKLEPEAT